jgi:4-amino-4-deoxy-L-arabinose transferase-like glycosyltransferase
MAKKILILILVIGFLLRFWQVGSLPTILNRDEAALAYNALLLKESGKDEWGKSWPLALESFGDYKLPGYPMLLVGTFSLFGYSDCVVRLPSVIAGTFLIWLAYLFIKKVWQQDDTVALFAAAAVALQPVFLFYSRMAWEANVGLAFLLGSLILLFKKTDVKKQFITDLAAVVLMFLAVFTYNTPLLLLPFIIPLVVWIRGLKSFKSWAPTVVGLGIVLLLGGASLVSLSKQKSGITIFSDESYWKQSVDFRLQFSGVAQKILGNRVVFFGGVILKNYFATFLPYFLVIHGGSHPWHAVPGTGHLYWIVYIAAIVGILTALWKLRHNLSSKKLSRSKIDLAMIYLLFISPLPAVITVDAPHATRSLLTFVIITFWTAKGLSFLLEKFSKNSRQILIAVLTILFIESSMYVYKYFIQYPAQSAEILRAGFEQVMQQVEKDPSLTKVAVIDEDGYQYISAAWYLKTSPQQFFATIDKHLPDRIGFRYGYKLEKYRFIFAPGDKFPDEQALVYWDKQAKEWKIQRF